MSVPAPLTARTRRRADALRRRLDRLHRTFDRRYLSTDPVAFVHRYTSRDDREVVAFLAAAFAFGNVRAIERSVASLLGVVGPSPARFVDGFDPVRDRPLVDALYHRWIRADDIAAALGVLGRIRRDFGSLEALFVAGHDPRAADVTESLAVFSERARSLAPEGHPGRVRRFFASPRDGSACKRLCLFLRWMVRGGDGIDLGLWSGVSTRQLVLPLDTHLVRLSRALGLTRRKSPGWPMAIESTRSLALLDPDDPVKYDFSLSRLGILDLCLHGIDPLDCRDCPVPAVRPVRTARSVRAAAPRARSGAERRC